MVEFEALGKPWKPTPFEFCEGCKHNHPVSGYLTPFNPTYGSCDQCACPSLFHVPLNSRESFIEKAIAEAVELLRDTVTLGTELFNEKYPAYDDEPEIYVGSWVARMLEESMRVEKK